MRSERIIFKTRSQVGRRKEVEGREREEMRTIGREVHGN